MHYCHTITVIDLLTMQLLLYAFVKADDDVVIVGINSPESELLKGDILVVAWLLILYNIERCLLCRVSKWLIKSIWDKLFAY